MINKQKTLGKCPEELGVKDAVHVAIVSCVAATAMKPGCRVKLNELGQAINVCEGGFGVADPWRDTIARGQNFWVVMDPTAVASVSHSWEHNVRFTSNPAPVKRDSTLEKYAGILGVSYDDLMQACGSYAKTNRKAAYPGTLAEDTVESAVEENIEMYELWSCWSDESGYEFDNMGSECCPEYEYPDDIPFEWV